MRDDREHCAAAVACWWNQCVKHLVLLWSVFWPDSFVNKKDWRILGTVKPMKYIPKSIPSSSSKVLVWDTISYKGFIRWFLETWKLLQYSSWIFCVNLWHHKMLYMTTNCWSLHYLNEHFKRSSHWIWFLEASSKLHLLAALFTNFDILWLFSVVSAWNIYCTVIIHKEV